MPQGVALRTMATAAQAQQIKAMRAVIAAQRGAGLSLMVAVLAAVVPAAQGLIISGASPLRVAVVLTTLAISAAGSAWAGLLLKVAMAAYPILT